ncbi:MAG TPA: polysaccharide deacetylase family protein [Feifaniaceae bacterium]|nr:polysaccharide deacetylase family protein [Feifaniaceae bacterium]
MRWLYKKGRTAVNILLAALMIALYIATTTPVAQSAMSELYNSPVYRGYGEGVVGLECAVSWNAAAMPELLKVLKERGVKITFFVSGEWAENNKELLVQIAQDGHEIGTMGQLPARDGSPDEVVADVGRSVEVIRAASGVEPKLYYSGTRHLKNSTRAANRLGLTHVLCTVDLLSGRGKAEDILLRALDAPFDGSILLIQPTAEAVKALPACISGLEQRGFRIVPVTETLGEHIQKEVRV